MKAQRNASRSEWLALAIAIALFTGSVVRTQSAEKFKMTTAILAIVL